MSDQLEGDLLAHYFQNAAIANVGDATGLPAAGTVGNLYVRLFTADPTDTGAVTNEATYTGYAPVAVPRNTSGWTKSGTSPTQVANTSAVAFPACTGGSNIITHFGISRTAISSTVDYSGPLSSPSSLSVSTGITPSFAAGSLIVSQD